MFRSRFSSALLVLSLGATLPSLAFSQTPAGEQLFKQGQQAFKGKQYEQAIQLFEQASIQGYDQGKLHQAWGSALYKRQQYEAARGHFEKAAQSEAFTQLAQLNLGLVALKLNQNAEAKKQLRLADSGSSASISKMAAELLRRMEDEQADSAAQSDTIFYVSARGGYEDKGVDPSTENTVASDQFAELNLFVSHTFLNRQDALLKAGANFFSLQKNKNAATELTMLSADVAYQKFFEKLQAEVSLGATKMKLAGDPYLDLLTPSLRLKSEIYKDINFTWQLDYEDNAAARDKFAYFEGDVIKNKFQVRKKLNKAYIDAQYKIEQEDRANLQSGNNYFDYSPTRQIIKLAYQTRQWSDWKLHTDLRYRRSDYDQAHAINGETKTRVDNQSQFSIKATYQFNKNISLVTKYKNTQNRSNWARYTYDRNEISLGVEWLTF